MGLIRRRGCLTASKIIWRRGALAHDRSRSYFSAVRLSTSGTHYHITRLRIAGKDLFFLYSTPFLRGFLRIILRIRDRTATACLSTYDFFLHLLLFWVEEREKKRTLYDDAWRCPTRRSIRSSFMYTFTPRPALLHPHLADDRCIINKSLSVYSSCLCGGGGGDGRPLKQGKTMPFIKFLALVIVPPWKEYITTDRWRNLWLMDDHLLSDVQWIERGSGYIYYSTLYVCI